jgi:hypothetical protein
VRQSVRKKNASAILVADEKARFEYNGIISCCVSLPSDIDTDGTTKFTNENLMVSVGSLVSRISIATDIAYNSNSECP